MTDTTKATTRVSQNEHPRHRRKIIAVIGPGDVVGFRLQRAKADSTTYIPMAALYDQAERRRAENLSGFSAAPCKDPKRFRNV